jgi:hypothetical protein
LSFPTSSFAYRLIATSWHFEPVELSSITIRETRESSRYVFIDSKVRDKIYAVSLVMKHQRKLLLGQRDIR